MNQGEKVVKRIFLKNLLNNECIHEKMEEFNQSIYRDVYEEGFILTKKITDDARRKISYRNGKQREAETKNVISFIGRRGTGKTSAMLSFYEALLNKDNVNYERKNNVIQEQKELGEEVIFVGIDYIDASRLEESEDIFTLVLAGMFNKLIEYNQENEIEEWENRTLYQKFEKIFDDFSLLKRKRESWDDSYSGFEKLRNIASSQKLREQFADLVEKYLEVLVRDRKSFQTSFLVIMIDDIDMRKKERNGQRVNVGAYDILQSIYQYLSVAKVIILTAYNHQYLYQQCIEYFSNNEKGICCGEKDYIAKSNTNEKMASQYMQKVLPIEARLYMPSWRKRDYGGEHWVDISDQNKYLKRFVEKNETLLDVKRFILNLMAEKSGIYYDCEGKKRHFFEPDTVRTLCSKILILMRLKEFKFPPKTDEDMEIYKRNLKRMKDDLFFRYVEEKLVRADEKLLFASWISQPIEQRGEAIVKEIAQHSHSNFERLGKKYKNKKNLKKIEESKELQTYSYAELVHSIYHMTRDDNIYSKELVACVLSSFSLYLSEIYWEYQYEKKKEEADYYEKYIKRNGQVDDAKVNQGLRSIANKYEIFLGVIGDTVCGHWVDYYFPEVEIKKKFSNREQMQKHLVSYIEKAEPRYVLELSLQKDIVLNERQIMKKKIKLQIYELIFVCMLQKDFLLPKKEIENPENKVIKDEDEKGTLTMNISFYGDLEFTAFLKYTFDYVKFFDKMDNIFFSKWVKELEREDFQDFANLIQEIVEEIREEYWEWDKSYGTMMIPLYNLDISYNLIKHIFQECERKPLEPFYFSLDDEKRYKSEFEKALEGEKEKSNEKRNSTGKFLEEYKKMLSRFSEHLKEIDKYYEISEKENFFEVFEKCPFIEMVEELKKNCSNHKEDFLLNDLFEFLNLIFKNLREEEEITKDPEEH